jgi:hypothetical protein
MNQQKELEQLKEKVSEYFINKGGFPKSVTEYMEDFPRGCSRQVIKSKTGLTCGQFLEIINKDYARPKQAISLLHEEVSRLNLKLISTVDKSTYKRSEKIIVECKKCYSRNTTTLESLRGSTIGCRTCAKNLPWNKRKEELKFLVKSKLDGSIIGEIPDNQLGYITIKCNACSTEYCTQLVGVVSPNSTNRGTCPNCRDTDKRVVYNNITFGSEFEFNCYQILKDFSPEMQVYYKDYLETERKYTCDFKIGNLFIEVSNFKIDYKNYFSNIEDKRALVGTNPKFKFFFLRSLKEVQEFVDSNLKDIVQTV